MKCDSCPLLYRQCGYETTEIEEYCLAGIEEDDMIEFKDLSVGCKMPWNKIAKIKKQIDKCRSCVHYYCDFTICEACHNDSNYEKG